MSHRLLNQETYIQKSSLGPVTVLQIGEGNFLRGFADWMLHVSREKGFFKGSVVVTQPRPGGKSKIEALAAQDGLYTLVERGIDAGERIERRTVVDIISEAFDPYGDWNKFLALSSSETLRIVISNTTEAGMAYRSEPLTDGAIQSFSGKMTYFLYRRYLAFNGDPDKGLVFLPCELIERNGDTLRDNVIQYGKDWNLPEAFLIWVSSCNRFLNSLVDRIVAGYPDEAQAQAWFDEWGYSDTQLTTAEPYHLWAIEGEETLGELLPLRQAGLNVVWTDDLVPFQQRKVRILNAAHTWMTPLGLLNGLEHVRQLTEHPTLGAAVRMTIRQEILPTLPDPGEDLFAYADTVFERFANPFIRHRLADIAINSLSKFKVRLLPSIQYYLERGSAIPEGLALGFAGLLRYYSVRWNGEAFKGRDLRGREYVVRDDEELLRQIGERWEYADKARQSLGETLQTLLSKTAIWGTDLSKHEGLLDVLIAGWARIGGEAQ